MKNFFSNSGLFLIIDGVKKIRPWQKLIFTSFILRADIYIEDVFVTDMNYAFFSIFYHKKLNSLDVHALKKLCLLNQQNSHFNEQKIIAPKKKFFFDVFRKCNGKRFLSIFFFLDIDQNIDRKSSRITFIINFMNAVVFGINLDISDMVFNYSHLFYKYWRHIKSVFWNQANMYSKMINNIIYLYNHFKRLHSDFLMSHAACKYSKKSTKYGKYLKKKGLMYYFERFHYFRCWNSTNYWFCEILNGLVMCIKRKHLFFHNNFFQSETKIIAQQVLLKKFNANLFRNVYDALYQQYPTNFHTKIIQNRPFIFFVSDIFILETVFQIFSEKLDSSLQFTFFEPIFRVVSKIYHKYIFNLCIRIKWLYICILYTKYSCVQKFERKPFFLHEYEFFFKCDDKKQMIYNKNLYASHLTNKINLWKPLKDHCYKDHCYYEKYEHNSNSKLLIFFNDAIRKFQIKTTIKNQIAYDARVCSFFPKKFINYDQIITMFFSKLKVEKKILEFLPVKNFLNFYIFPVSFLEILEKKININMLSKIYIVLKYYSRKIGKIANFIATLYDNFIGYFFGEIYENTSVTEQRLNEVVNKYYGNKSKAYLNKEKSIVSNNSISSNKKTLSKINNLIFLQKCLAIQFLTPEQNSQLFTKDIRAGLHGLSNEFVGYAFKPFFSWQRILINFKKILIAFFYNEEKNLKLFQCQNVFSNVISCLLHSYCLNRLLLQFDFKNGDYIRSLKFEIFFCFYKRFETGIQNQIVKNIARINELDHENKDLKFHNLKKKMTRLPINSKIWGTKNQWLFFNLRQTKKSATCDA